jgi:Thioredoxin-like
MKLKNALFVLIFWLHGLSHAAVILPKQNQLAQQLSGELVVVGDKTVTTYDSVQLSRYQLLFVYYCAKWCPESREVTPKILTTYRKMKADGISCEMILVPRERTEADILASVREHGIQCPVFGVSLTSGHRLALDWVERWIPYLNVYDQKGNRLAHSDLKTTALSIMEQFASPPKSKK